MATHLKDTGCCALREIDNLSDSTTPDAALKAVFLGLMNWGASPFVLFTGVSTRRGIDHTFSRRPDNYGLAFKEFLEANGLGSVIQSEERTNRSTGNGVTVWVWHVDREKLTEWGLANGFTDTWDPITGGIWTPATF